MGGRCSPDIHGKQGVRNHEQSHSFGACAGVYLVRLWHTLKLLPVLHGAIFPFFDKDDQIHGKGQK